VSGQFIYRTEPSKGFTIEQIKESSKRQPSCLFSKTSILKALVSTASSHETLGEIGEKKTL
jgi:hypothetical protein